MNSPLVDTDMRSTYDMISHYASLGRTIRMKRVKGPASVNPAGISGEQCRHDDREHSTEEYSRHEGRNHRLDAFPAIGVEVAEFGVRKDKGRVIKLVACRPAENDKLERIRCPAAAIVIVLLRPPFHVIVIDPIVGNGKNIARNEKGREAEDEDPPSQPSHEPPAQHDRRREETHASGQETTPWSGLHRRVRSTFNTINGVVS